MSARALVSSVLALAIPLSLAWRWWTMRVNARRKEIEEEEDLATLMASLLDDESPQDSPRLPKPNRRLHNDSIYDDWDKPEGTNPDPLIHGAEGIRYKHMVQGFALLTDACRYMKDCHQSLVYSVNWPRIVFCAHFAAECSIKSLIAWKKLTPAFAHNLSGLVKSLGSYSFEDPLISDRLKQLCSEFESLSTYEACLSVSARYPNVMPGNDYTVDDSTQPSLVYERDEAIKACDLAQEIYNISYGEFRAKAEQFNQEVNIGKFVPSLSSDSCQWRFETSSISWSKPGCCSRKPSATNDFYVCETNFVFE